MIDEEIAAEIKSFRQFEGLDLSVIPDNRKVDTV